MFPFPIPGPLGDVSVYRHFLLPHNLAAFTWMEKPVWICAIYEDMLQKFYLQLIKNEYWNKCDVILTEVCNKGKQMDHKTNELIENNDDDLDQTSEQFIQSNSNNDKSTYFNLYNSRLQSYFLENESKTDRISQDGLLCRYP